MALAQWHPHLARWLIEKLQIMALYQAKIIIRHLLLLHAIHSATKFLLRHRWQKIYIIWFESGSNILWQTTGFQVRIANVWGLNSVYMKSLTIKFLVSFVMFAMMCHSSEEPQSGLTISPFHNHTPESQRVHTTFTELLWHGGLILCQIQPYLQYTAPLIIWQMQLHQGCRPLQSSTY